jgi:hypothetical protein
MWGALSDERTVLSITVAAEPSQRSHSRVRVQWDWRSYFSVPGLRLSFSSPPTTRRATVEVLDPASTRESIEMSLSLILRSTVSRPVCLGIKHPWGAYDQSFITIRQLRVCWCGALSLTRGRVCRLQYLLALSSAVIEASIALNDVTLTDSLIRWSPNEWHSVWREIPQCLPIRCTERLISLHNEHCRNVGIP